MTETELQRLEGMLKGETVIVGSWYSRNKVTIWVVAILLLIASGLIFYYVHHNPNNPIPGIVKPDKVITQQVTDVVKDKRIDSIQAEDSLHLVYLNKLLDENAALQRSNQILAAKLGTIWIRTDTVFSDHTALDYTEQLIDAVSESDSSCNVVITAFKDELKLKDSMNGLLKTDKMILISSFNELGYNSVQKDRDIKKLNQSIRWQKVKTWGAIAAAGYLLFKFISK